MLCESCCAVLVRLVARLMRSDPGEERALLFGLGMNNNGTGMVLASQARLPWQVQVLIVCYNLVQHLVAASVDHWVCKAALVAEEGAGSR